MADAVRQAWYLTTASAIAAAKASNKNPATVSVTEMVDDYVRLHVDLAGKAVSQKWALVPVKREIGSRPVATVREDARGYIGLRIAAGIKPGTIRRELGALRAALGWAEKELYFGKDWDAPDILLTPPSPPRTNVLTASEYIGLRSILTERVVEGNASRADAFVAIALETASRTDAIEGLTWDRVDFAKRLIDFRDPRKSAKANKRRVVVPMSDWLVTYMSHWQLTQNAVYPTKPNFYVLTHSGSTRKAYATLMSGFGLGHITRHDLRRSWATLRASWGVPLWEIAGVLGDNPATVSKHYAHHSPGFLRNAVNATGPVGASGVKSP